MGCIGVLLLMIIVFVGLGLIASLFTQAPIIGILLLIVIGIYFYARYSNQQQIQQRKQKARKDSQYARKKYIHKIAPVGWKYRISDKFSEEDCRTLGGKHIGTCTRYMFVDKNKVVMVPEGNGTTYYLIGLKHFRDNGNIIGISVLTLITTNGDRIIKLTPRMSDYVALFTEKHFLLNNLERKRLNI